MKKTITGYDIVTPRDIQLHIANGQYKYALYPVWLLNTTWNGKKFTFAMNGQTGKFVGDLPLDKGRFWKYVSLFGLGIAAVMYAVLWIIALM